MPSGSEVPESNRKSSSFESTNSESTNSKSAGSNSKDSNTASSKLAKAELTATAFHEAGHAVAALVLGRPVEKVTIAPSRSSTGRMNLGICKIQKGRTKPTKDWLEDEAMILFAGMVSESHFTGQYCQQGAGQDLRAARRLLSQTRATTERQLEKLERRLLDKTEHLLDEECNTKAIEMIAAELIANETISGRAVKHLFNQAVQKYS